jgi:hypothetical protein
MRRFLNNLLRDIRSTRTPRPARRAPRCSNLQVEGLEDRLVLTSATQVGSTLFINNIGTNHAIALASNGARGMEIFDNGTLINKNHLFNIGSITAVNITVAGNDSLFVVDSNGMPFDQKATITLFGSGANNSLTLEGTRAISGNETYVAGGASFTPGKIFVDNLTFVLNSAIASVTDRFQITGVLDVQTSGTSVGLFGTNGSTQTLSGMGFGGGDTLTYANKPAVRLEDFAANAVISLNATAPAALEQSFFVMMHGAGDSTVIATTPSHVITDVFSTIAPVANPASVFLRGNAGPVSVFGNSSTFLSVGQPLSNGEFSTKGIRANVAAFGVGDLFLSDSGNVATPENVKVTESTISGLGLFGNNGVTLSYGNVGTVNLVTGQDTAAYTVIGSHAGAQFNSKITITYFSTLLANVLIRADVFVDSGSHLNLQLFNDTKQLSTELFIHPGVGLASLPGTHSGTVDVTYPGVPNSLSQIGYDGFTLVTVVG